MFPDSILKYQRMLSLPDIIMKWLYISVLLLFSHTSIASVMNNNHLDSCFIQAGKRYLIAPELRKPLHSRKAAGRHCDKSQ